MNPQSFTKFGANRSSLLTASQDFWMCDPLTPPPPPRHAPWCIEGRLVFSLYPFPDESADVNQSWCQSVQPFDSFPWPLIVWPPKTPQVPPLCLSWQFVWRISIPRWIYKVGANRTSRLNLPLIFEFVTPTPPSPPKSRGELYLAYVHSQTNPQTCTKFGVNRSSRLTASQTFWCVTP